MSGRQMPSYTTEQLEKLEKEPFVGLCLVPVWWAMRQASYVTTALSNSVQDMTDPRRTLEEAPRLQWQQKTAAQRLLDGVAICFVMFGTNTAYVNFSEFQGKAPESVGFLPKPGLATYTPGRLAPPVGYTLQSIVNVLSPDIPGTPIAIPDVKVFEKRDTVWTDLNFYLAFTTVLGIQLVEALVIRRVALSIKKERFQKADSTTKATPSPNAILDAHVQALSVNTHGLGGYGLVAVAIMLVYAVEFSLFGISVRGAKTNPLLLLILACAETFGAELSWGLSDRITAS